MFTSHVEERCAVMHVRNIALRVANRVLRYQRRGIFLPKLLYNKDNEFTQNIHRLFRVASYTWLSNIIICTVAMWSKFLMCLSFTFLIRQLAFRRIVILWRKIIIDQCHRSLLLSWCVGLWYEMLHYKNVFFVHCNDLPLFNINKSFSTVHCILLVMLETWSRMPFARIFIAGFFSLCLYIIILPYLYVIIYCT